VQPTEAFLKAIIDDLPGEPAPMNKANTTPAPLALPAGEVHLWVAPVGDGGDDPVVAAQGILAADEIARLERIRPAAGRRLFLTARRFLRETLSRYGDRAPAAWRFATNAHGKPRITPESGVPPLAFNLSHTAGIAVLALTRGAEVGVDVERAARRVQARQLSDRFFSPREAVALAELPPERLAERFFYHWTLKEACLKALGRGLTLPLHTIDFALSGERPFRIAWTGEGLPPHAGFRFFLLEPLPGFVAAVCLAGDGPTPVLRGFHMVAGKVAPVALEPIGQSWSTDSPATRS
jgi:4'-phosphopantetheinyl transferase